MLILYGLAAAGVVEGWRAGGLARVAAVVTGLILVNPQLEPLLPVAVFAPGRRRTSRRRDLGAARRGGHAGRRWPAGTARTSPSPGTSTRSTRCTTPTVLGAAALAALILDRPRADGAASAAGRRWPRRRAPCSGWGPTPTRASARKWETGAWRDVAGLGPRSTRPKTPSSSRRPQEAGFRVFSERTVVGEWKDGTQQYFDETFATEWAARMEALGRADYVKMTDEQLTQIARRFGASFVVVPTRRRGHPGPGRGIPEQPLRRVSRAPVGGRRTRGAHPHRGEPTRGDLGAPRRPSSSWLSSPPDRVLAARPPGLVRLDAGAPAGDFLGEGWSESIRTDLDPDVGALDPIRGRLQSIPLPRRVARRGDRPPLAAREGRAAPRAARAGARAHGGRVPRRRARRGRDHRPQGALGAATTSSSCRTDRGGLEAVLALRPLPMVRVPDEFMAHPVVWMADMEASAPAGLVFSTARARPPGRGDARRLRLRAADRRGGHGGRARDRWPRRRRFSWARTLAPLPLFLA